MKLNHKTRWLIILALVALLAVGSAGTVAAVGNRHLPRFSHIVPDHLVSGLRHTWRGHGNFDLQADLIDRAAIAAAAANTLGVNPDELQSAMQAGKDSVQALLEASGLEFADVRTAVNTEIEPQLAAAVEAGTLTQDEMDAILSRDLNRMGLGRGRHGRFGEWMWSTSPIDAQAVLQAAAEDAGLNADELLAALAEGRSAVNTFLEANDTTSAEFKAALDAVWQQAIADAVEAGTLTEEQADHLNRKGNLGRGLDGGRHRGWHEHGWQRGLGNLSPTEDNA
ncbi:MAG: hypothetical protein F4Y80_07565 [Caldilineaceae bacterium SB0665_bin_21]|nr:hypothetical protein [Caldilineaceae bacterium SB0665_bin_21]